MSSLPSPEADVVRSPTDLRLFTRPALKQKKALGICERVRALIVSGKLKPGTQLPSEVELAEAFGVSRNTLRDSLNILHQEGTILRRHGVGTFVTHQLLMPNRLDVNLSTTDLIRSTGWEPGDAEMSVRMVEAEGELADLLDTSPGRPLVEIERVRTAGAKRVVYSFDRFQAKFLELSPSPLSIPEVVRFLREQKSMYRLLEQRLGLTLAYAVATIKPATADENLAERLQVPAGTQLMYLVQTDFDAGGQPLFVSHEYHIADVYSFTVFRKR
jgi:GntR family transcriptional regulator